MRRLVVELSPYFRRFTRHGHQCHAFRDRGELCNQQSVLARRRLSLVDARRVHEPTNRRRGVGGRLTLGVVIGVDLVEIAEAAVPILVMRNVEPGYLERVNFSELNQINRTAPVRRQCHPCSALAK